MSMPTLSIACRHPAAETRFGPGSASRVAAAHRAGLARGITFALLLASSSLACVYIPTFAQGPGWEEGTAPSR